MAQAEHRMHFFAVKRPIACVGFSLAAALAILYTLGLLWLSAFFMLLCLSVLFFLHAKEKLRAAKCLLSAGAVLFALLLWGLDTAYAEHMIDTYGGKQVLVSGTVMASQRYDDWWLVQARLERIQGEKETLEVSFFCEEALLAGDAFSAQVTFETGRSPYTEYLSMRAELDRLIAVRPQARRLLSWANTLRSRAGEAILKLLPNREGMVTAAMLTGNKSILPVELSLMFNRAGVSHIIVVSGLHITLFVSAVLTVARTAHAKRGVQMILLVGVVAACLLFYGAGASVVRACIMSFILYSGELFLRRSDPVTSIAVAAIIFLVLRPAAIVEISFLLSFSCCVALSVVWPQVQKRLFRRLKETKPSFGKKIIEGVSLSVVISLVTFPVLALAGMPFSLTAPLSNIIVVPLSGALTLLAFFCCVPVEVVARVAALAAGLAAKGIVESSRFFASWKMAAVDTTAGYLKIFLLFCASVLVVSLFFRTKKSRVETTVLCVLLVLLTGILSRFYLIVGRPQIVLYNEYITLFYDRQQTLIVVDRADMRDMDTVADYCQRRFLSMPICVILLKDNGQATERRAHEVFDCRTVSLYTPHLAQTVHDEEASAYLAYVGRLSINADRGRNVTAQYNGSLSAIFYNEIQYAGDFAVTVIRNEGEFRYIWFDSGNGSDTFDADDRVVVYLREDGTGKAATE